MSTPLKLLLAEDRPADAALVVRLLRNSGFHLDWTRVDTEEAFRAGLEPSLDVIISDFAMPRFSALRALELLQESGLAIPFIVVSGTIGEETAVEVMKRGATDYLLKDRLARLGHVIAQALQARREREERERMSAALAAAQARYRSIFDNALEGIYRAAPDGSLITANPALARMLGYPSPEDLMAGVTDLWTQVHVEPEHREALMALLRERGVAQAFETRARRRDGTCLWISEHVRAVRGEDGQVLGFDGMVQDITERKGTERRLAAQYAVHQVLATAETLREAVSGVVRAICESLSWDVGTMWTVDAESGTLRCAGFWQGPEIDVPDFQAACQGAAFEPSMGFPGSVWTNGRPAWVPDVTRDPGYLRKEGARRAGLHASLACPIRNGEETLGVVEFLSREVREPNPEVLELAESITGQVGMFLRRRQAEEAMEESRQRFLQLAESIHEVFWLTTPDGGEILYVSPAYETIWGRTCRSAYEAPHSFLDAVHPEDLPHVLSLLEQQKQAEGRFEKEYRILRPDGGVRWIRDRSFPILDEHGRRLRVAGIAEDITESKELERKYLQAQKMEAVGQLAGGVAHDFNNVLTAILGYSDLLQDTLSPNDPRLDYVDEVRRAGDRASGLTRQLLAFSRRQVLEPRVLDLHEVVSGMVGMVERLIGEHIDLDCVAGQEVGLVKADPGQIEQVIMNLVVNASDAMPHGGRLVLETGVSLLDERTHPDVPAGRYARLSVSDTGCGMPEDVKARVFEPFFTTKPKGKGTGLGLSTCFGIVKQSGGHLAVYSEQGHGTTVTMYLPVIAHDGAPAPVPEEVDRKPRGGETILLVEDEEAVRRLSATILRSLGYHVLVAADGEDALRLADECPHPIALVLTDVIMPRMSGRGVADRMRISHPGTRFLFCSGYTADAIGHHGVLEPGVAFLQKPFTPASLAVKVREVLDATPVLN